jgi:aminodeoxyfutalosine deaminase
VARIAVAHAPLGVVGLDLTGHETAEPADTYARAFAIARDGGLGCVPHAGWELGPRAVRTAIDTLGATRIGHGIRAAEDPDLLADLATQQIVLEVCLTSEVAIGAVSSIENHPLPSLLAAGVPCSISTDDPAIFDTSLGHEYELLPTIGGSARAAYFAGVQGALCDTDIRDELIAVGNDATWTGE